VGAEDPRLNTSGNNDFHLSRMISKWKKEDPPPNRVKPILIQVIRRLAFISMNLTCELTNCITYMTMIAAYAYPKSPPKNFGPDRRGSIKSL